MSFDLIDLTEIFLKMAAGNFTKMFICSHRGNVKTDNIHPNYKEN
jgi:hypothetical protein